MGLETVSRILWKERELLELLLFKLEEEQLVLTSGRSKWLPHATREVEAVLEQMRRTELLRAVEVDAAAAELGLAAGPSLTELADAADEPWRQLLHSHRRGLLGLTTEISGTAAANREILGTAERATRDALLSLSESVQTYTADGSTVSTPSPARLVDEAV
jgi:hypothetical protein